MRALRVLVSVLGALLASQSVRAEDPDFARPGAYVGVGASRSSNLVEAYLDGTPILEDVDVDNSWGVNARVGYRFASWFALEAEYEWLDPFTARLNGVDVGTLEFQSATANLRFILPLHRFQPYLLLGAGALFVSVDTPVDTIEVDHSAFAGRLGLGLDVYLTENLLLNVGAEGVLGASEVRLETGGTSVSERGLGTITFQAGLGWRF